MTLIDSYNRVHRNLRVSVTDRCDLRCRYCMPAENVEFLPRAEILSYEEISRVVRIACQLGIERVRLTGGEPLLRRDLHRLVAALREISGLEEIALTTNATFLKQQAQSLKDAGLDRLNISLDTLDEQRFRQLTRRSGVARIIEAILHAKDIGFEQIRLNAVAIADQSEPDIIPLVEFAREHNLHIRFIEFMPLDAQHRWQSEQVLSGDFLLQHLEQHFGPLRKVGRPHPAQPSMDYEFDDGRGKVGLINPVSQPFCGNCDRLRLTADGKLRNCLFSIEEWDVREMLRGGGSDQSIGVAMAKCVREKKAGHGIDDPTFLRPARAMYQIGG